MMLLLIALFSVSSHAGKATHKEGVREEGNTCAKIGLAAIYGAERSYHSEFHVYSDSYNDIGYAPEGDRCTSWRGDIRLFNGGKEFLATYTRSTTGETWTINDKKELVQTDKGRE